MGCPVEEWNMSTTSNPLRATEIGLLAEALRWRALGLLFERPRPEIEGLLARLAPEIDDPVLEELAEQAATAITAEHHVAVFGPGGTVSPREIAYHRMGDPGHLLARLNALYAQFAYAPKTEEPPDHVAVECGFLGFLRLKQAFARSEGAHDAVREIERAFALVRTEHVAVLASGLRAKLDPDRHGPFARAVEVLENLCGPVPEPVVRAASAAACDPANWDSCLSGCPFDCED
jgi:nitrate reductase assembly molybdenum cofactor insertion protein NarJ